MAKNYEKIVPFVFLFVLYLIVVPIIVSRFNKNLIIIIVSPYIVYGITLLIYLILIKQTKYTYKKILYFMPILVFFVAWWVDVGFSISYLAPYLENQGLDIADWALRWPRLTDHYLIYTNTFSSLFFGCYSWSIITYYLGTKNPECFLRAIKSINLCFPFWFGLSIYLGIIGKESYQNAWLSVHIIFGIWVALGSIIAIFMVISFIGEEDLDFGGGPKYRIPRSKPIKLIDYFDRYQALFFILIILIIGTFFSILIWKESTNLAFTSIFWTFLTMVLIFLLNFLYSIKIDYHRSIRQKEGELLLNEFQVLLRRSKELAERGNKSYSKKSYQPAIENWKKSITYYEEALKKAAEKDKIKENLEILNESLFNAYKGRANVHNKNALKAYEKSDLQIAQKEWGLAISTFQAAIDLSKDKKLNYSSEDLQNAIKNSEIRQKQLEIEMLILDADNELKEARSLQKKDLRKAIKMVNDIILKYSEAKEKANKNALFKPLSEKLETKFINCRDFQSELQDKIDKLIDITPLTTKVIIDDIGEASYDNIKAEKIKKTLSIIREFEFIGGQIRFKIALINNTRNPLTNFKISLDIPDALKWIMHEPNYERKGDSILIPKVGINEKKQFHCI